MERETLFADVILPLGLPNLYTYRIPYEWNNEVKAGQRVIVQFGKNKLYTAIIRNLHTQAPQHYIAKYIVNILDEFPQVNALQLRLWDWIASYYLCNIGDVMNAALPSGMRISSETKIILSQKYHTGEAPEENNIQLTDQEVLIVDALESQEIITLTEAGQILGLKNAFPVIKSLIHKGIVLLHEEIKERYKPKTENYIGLTTYANEEENLKKVFDQLEKRAFKQLQLLMAFIKLSGRYSENEHFVSKSELLKESGAKDATLNELVKKNVLEIYEEQQWRLQSGAAGTSVIELSEYQHKAYEEIKRQFSLKDVVLLQGVTSSGKTELYIKLMEEALAQGKQVLYLLPEIALTTQIINRLRKNFGDKVGVYHSRYNENERVEVWERVRGTGFKNEEPEKSESTIPDETEKSSSFYGEYQIILGARSAVFLPFDNLGLIIVDEEHDSSYKQFDPAPRYHARDTAIFLGSIHKAKVLLGSATPSLESYYNYEAGKYGFAALTKRYGDQQMPEILLADIAEETRKKRMKSHFTPFLLDNIQIALDNKDQVILFQNRRGYTPIMECTSCGWVPQCKRCDVTMTYHKSINMMRCHYCGYTIKPSVTCPACGNTKLKSMGLGTEKIEEELQIYFPQARILRMDFDSTRSKHSYQKIISDFEERNVDILVGTQMVTKGLDFGNVALVGILNADNLMAYPDFRSQERGYQLMAQVSGRAGRRKKRGRVIIQTYNPKNPLIHYVVENNYRDMYVTQLAERKQYNYPPFCRIIEISLKHKNIETLEEASSYFARSLKEIFGNRLLGPTSPLIPRIKNLYIKTILLKIEKAASLHAAKEHLAAKILDFKIQNSYKSVIVSIDVDPM